MSFRDPESGSWGNFRKFSWSFPKTLTSSKPSRPAVSTGLQHWAIVLISKLSNNTVRILLAGSLGVKSLHCRENLRKMLPLFRLNAAKRRGGSTFCLASSIGVPNSFFDPKKPIEMDCEIRNQNFRFKTSESAEIRKPSTDNFVTSDC